MIMIMYQRKGKEFLFLSFQNFLMIFLIIIIIWNISLTPIITNLFIGLPVVICPKEISHLSTVIKSLLFGSLDIQLYVAAYKLTFLCYDPSDLRSLLTVKLNKNYILKTINERKFKQNRQKKK